MAAMLNSVILNLAILNSAIIIFPPKHTHTCQDWFPPFAQIKLHSHFPPHHLNKKTSLIHSDSTWWWWPSWFWPSWILPSWIQLLYCGIQTPCFLLSDSLKSTLPPLWLWLKLIQSDSNSFILNNMMMAAILNSVILNLAILNSAIIIFPPKHTHTWQDWFPPFAQKNFTHTSLPTIWTKKLHSFILTQLDDGGHLVFCHFGFRHCHLGFRHLVFFSQIHSKTLSLHSDSDSN